jgi:isopentenyldiphosphate isomerase
MRLTRSQLEELRRDQRAVGSGEHLTQQQVDALLHKWTRELGGEVGSGEQFPVTTVHGDYTGVLGPRWLIHLLGIRHAAVDVGLITPNGLVVLQRRSLTKADSPGAWDIAVSGHVSAENGTPHSWQEAALKELGEELGLNSPQDELRQPGLQQTEQPFCCFDARPTDNPPHLNAEVRVLFCAELTEIGLAHLYPCPEELSGIGLFTPREAWHLATTQPVASGLYYSLPKLLDWAVKRGAAE